jgi:hypothetical protein
MRTDQSSASAAAALRHARSYANRWMAIRPWVLMALGSGSSLSADVVERFEGYRLRHHDRLLLLHQSFGIPMNIIRRHALDDPRLSEPEMRKRLQQYRERKAIYDSMKHKRKAG